MFPCVTSVYSLSLLDLQFSPRHLLEMCLLWLYPFSNQDHIAGWVPAPDPSADQEAGGASAEGVLQRRPHHPAPACSGGEDRRLVQKPDEEVKTFFRQYQVWRDREYKERVLTGAALYSYVLYARLHHNHVIVIYKQFDMFVLLYMWNGDNLMKLNPLAIDQTAISFLAELICWHLSRLHPLKKGQGWA